MKFYLVILSLQLNRILSLFFSHHPVSLSVCLSQMSNHSSDPEEEIWGKRRDKEDTDQVPNTEEENQDNTHIRDFIPL